MRYKKYIQSILGELEVFKKEVDGLSESYLKERDNLEKKLDPNIYSQNYIDEMRSKWVPHTDYKEYYESFKMRHLTACLGYLDAIRSEADAYFQTPPDSELTNTVSAIKATGLSISDQEFATLKRSCKNYWSLRILDQIGKTRSMEVRETKVDHGNLKNIEVAKKIPYTQVEYPDIDATYDAISAVKQAVTSAFDYLGTDNVLRQVVTGQTGDLGALGIAKASLTERAISPDYHAYSTLLSAMEEVEKMQTSTQKTVFTPDDKRLVDTLINPAYPIVAQDKAVEIAKNDKRLAEILSADPRYSQAVKEALAETEVAK